MKQIKKILYPTDLSSISLTALEYALTFVKLYDAQIYVLNVIDNLFYDDLIIETPETNAFFRSIEEIARMDLKKYLNENFDSTPDIFQIVKCGNPKEEILKFTEEQEIDLIILSSNEQSTDFDSGKDNLMATLLSQTKIPVLSLNKPETTNSNSYFSVDDKKFQLNNFGLTLFN